MPAAAVSLGCHWRVISKNTYFARPRIEVRKPLNTPDARLPSWRNRLSGFDFFVLAGAAVNLMVIAYLIGYWLATR